MSLRWFRRRPAHAGLAVVTPAPGGIGAARVAAHTDPPRLEAYAWHHAPLPDSASLAHLAGEIGARASPILALLDAAHYQAVVVEAPAVPDDELLGAVRWKVRDLINFHIDDAVLDHLPIPMPAGRARMLYVVAAQAQAVRELVRPYHQAGLEMAVIDVRESAQNALAARLAPPDYAVAVLHLGAEHGLLTFSFAGELVLSRRIDGRGASGEALLDKVALETQRSVDYFERQYAWFPLARLHLAPMPDAAGLRARLLEYLPVGVEVIDLAVMFDLAGHPGLSSPAQHNQAFHLLGAALRESA